ncbi:DUF1385 domain-containing protein [bacterium]|nr:DUF1385 domain-containing protein [bacterium]
MDKDNGMAVGGQAVIEGVMMRSPEYVSVAVRRQDGTIVLKREPYVSYTKRVTLLGLPFIRGGVTLIESMVLGIRALNFSGDVAMAEENEQSGKRHGSSRKEKPFLEKLATAGMIVLALGLGIGLFFYVPLLLTDLTGVKDGVMFNLIDGVFRLTIFLAYMVLISLWKEIRRVFEYHGAEHKSIFAYENKLDLTVEKTKGFKTFHPRCGTSFLLIVMLVSILVFVMLGRPETVTDRLIRFLFVPVIGGISYEITRLAGKKFGSRLARVLIAPGLWLQKITTKEPDEAQLEVALVALHSALDMDINADVELYTAKG